MSGGLDPIPRPDPATKDIAPGLHFVQGPGTERPGSFAELEQLPDSELIELLASELRDLAETWSDMSQQLGDSFQRLAHAEGVGRDRFEAFSRRCEDLAWRLLERVDAASSPTPAYFRYVRRLGDFLDNVVHALPPQAQLAWAEKVAPIAATKLHELCLHLDQTDYAGLAASDLALVLAAFTRAASDDDRAVPEASKRIVESEVAKVAPEIINLASSAPLSNGKLELLLAMVMACRVLREKSIAEALLTAQERLSQALYPAPTDRSLEDAIESLTRPPASVLVAAPESRHDPDEIKGPYFAVLDCLAQYSRTLRTGTFPAPLRERLIKMWEEVAAREDDQTLRYAAGGLAALDVRRAMRFIPEVWRMCNDEEKDFDHQDLFYLLWEVISTPEAVEPLAISMAQLGREPALEMLETLRPIANLDGITTEIKRNFVLLDGALRARLPRF